METTPYIPKEAVTALQAMIQDWLEENPKRSRSSLARGAGVAEATIRRVTNDGTLPQPYNISKIVSFIRGVSSNKEIIESSGPSLSKVIAYHLPYKAFEEVASYKNLGADVEATLNSSTKKLIFIKANATNGMSLEEVKNDFGQFGLIAAQDLIDQGLLLKSENTLHVPNEFRDHSFSPVASKENIVDGTRLYYKPETETNYSFNVVDGVSVKGYNQVMDIIQDAHNKISAAVKEYPGAVPLFASGVMDTMTTTSYFEKMEAQS